MKMISLRSLAPIALLALTVAVLPPRDCFANIQAGIPAQDDASLSQQGDALKLAKADKRRPAKQLAPTVLSDLMAVAHHHSQEHIPVRPLEILASSESLPSMSKITDSSPEESQAEAEKKQAENAGASKLTQSPDDAQEKPKESNKDKAPLEKGKDKSQLEKDKDKAQLEKGKGKSLGKPEGPESEEEAKSSEGEEKKGSKFWKMVHIGKKKDDEKAEAAGPLSATEAAEQDAIAERAKALKSMSTPFNTAGSDPKSGDGELAPLSLHSGGRPRSSLASRLVPNRVYLPPKMILGKSAEFVVKAHPGYMAAIAMADKDSGAKAINGINLRLGPDRKLVAAGTIPATGVLSLIVDMPIQGDLIGLPVFFETVIWQKPDFSDIELAQPVKSESATEISDKANAVIVSPESSHKHGVRFVPESAVPQYQRPNNDTLESGRP